MGRRITLAFCGLTALTLLAAGAGAWGVWRLQTGHEAIADLADLGSVLRIFEAPVGVGA